MYYSRWCAIHHYPHIEHSPFRGLGAHQLWHIYCRARYHMKLTPFLFRTLSKEITTGNPLWALAVLNEYLTANDPIRRACVHHAQARLSPAVRNSDLFVRLVRGETYIELPSELRAHVGCKETITARSVPTPSPRSTDSRARRNVTQRRPVTHARLRTKIARISEQKSSNVRPASHALGVALASVRRSS